MFADFNLDIYYKGEDIDQFFFSWIFEIYLHKIHFWNFIIFFIYDILYNVHTHASTHARTHARSQGEAINLSTLNITVIFRDMKILW